MPNQSPEPTSGLRPALVYLSRWAKMKIVDARLEDAGALTNIALAAKGHWGYPESWIRRWKDVLTITPEYIASHPTFVAVTNEGIVGFGALQIHASDALLDHLWVVPHAMRQGVGRILFAHAEEKARHLGAHRLKIVGDPNAEGFYRRMGAALYGREPAHMDDRERYLPLLEKVL